MKDEFFFPVLPLSLPYYKLIDLLSSHLFYHISILGFRVGMTRKPLVVGLEDFVALIIRKMLGFSRKTDPQVDRQNLRLFGKNQV